MKIRKIPYGYCYENGTITVHPVESKELQKIYFEYLTGKSLLKIAERLNAEMVEYMGEKCGWNKARIKRILEDERYLGNDVYPSIIEGNIHKKIAEIKYCKNTQKDVNRQEDIFQLNVGVLCPDCGANMYRRRDSRYKHKIKWHCGNRRCKKFISKSDTELLEDIKRLLNQVIREPDTIEVPNLDEVSIGLEISSLDSEIEWMMNSKEEKAVIKAKIIERTLKRYEEIPNNYVQARKLKDYFTEQTVKETLDFYLLARTVRNIRFFSNGHISLILMNGQRITEEVNYEHASK